MNLAISLLLVTVGSVIAQDTTALDLSPIASLEDYSTLLAALSTSGADQVIADSLPVAVATILGLLGTIIALSNNYFARSGKSREK